MTIATKSPRLFEFPREGVLARMVHRIALNDNREVALVGHLLYHVRSSTMSSDDIARTWITSLSEVQRSYGKGNVEFMQRADSLFQRLIRVMVLDRGGVDEEGIRSIMESKRVLELAMQTRNLQVKGLSRR